MEETVRCRRCHRALKNDRSKAIGYGPVCAMKEYERQREENTIGTASRSGHISSWASL